MICGKCKNNIPDTAKFCPKCGAKVEVEKPKDVIICPRCGAENPLAARFCRKDGTPLKEAAKPPETTEKIIERKPQEVVPAKARKAPIWIAISILIIILAGAGTYLYFSGIIGKKAEEVTITQPSSFTKRFKGAIGEYKIQMELHREGDNLSGTYFYERIRRNLYLKGTVDDKGNFTINAFDDKGNQTDIFKGKFTSSSELSGMWCKPSGEKTLPFLLQEVSFLPSEEESKPPQYVAYDPNDTYCNIRSGPGVNYNIIATLPNGEKIQPTDKEHLNWKEIIITDGRIGWIYKNLVRKEGFE